MDIFEMTFYVSVVAMLVAFGNAFLLVLMLRRTKKSKVTPFASASKEESKVAEVMMEQAAKGDKKAIKWLEDHGYEKAEE